MKKQKKNALDGKKTRKPRKKSSVSRKKRGYKSIFIEKSLPKLYQVEWYDHWSANFGAWVRLENLDVEPPVCRTVGYKIKEGKDAILFATTLTNEGASGGVWGILKKNIKSLVQI